MARYVIDNVPASVDFRSKDNIRRTLQNAKNLLMCRMGEVPYDRLRGFDHALYDLPLSQFREELMPELDRIMEWDPDVNVVGAEATMLPNGDTYIQAFLEINMTGVTGEVD